MMTNFPQNRGLFENLHGDISTEGGGGGQRLDSQESQTRVAMLTACVCGCTRDGEVGIAEVWLALGCMWATRPMVGGLTPGRGFIRRRPIHT
jgi:hypothetical protein